MNKRNREEQRTGAQTHHNRGALRHKTHSQPDTHAARHRANESTAGETEGRNKGGVTTEDRHKHGGSRFSKKQNKKYKEGDLQPTATWSCRHRRKGRGGEPRRKGPKSGWSEKTSQSEGYPENTNSA